MNHFIDRVLKCGQLAGYAAGLCYFLGILIVNFYYVKYRFVTFELFRVKYVFAGLWFILLMGIFTYLVWLIFVKANDLKGQFNSNIKGWKSNLKIVVIKICFGLGMLSFLVVIMSMVLSFLLVQRPYAPTLFNIKITNRWFYIGIAIFLVSQFYILAMTNWLKRHSLFYYIFLGLSCIGLLLFEFPFWGAYFVSFMLFICFLFTIKDILGLFRQPNFIKNVMEEKHAKDFLLSLLWLSWTLGSFSTTIYSNIKPELGGGHPIIAKVNGSADFLTRLNQSGVVIKSDSSGSVVSILDRSNSELFFLAGNQVIAVPVNEIKFIKYLSLESDTTKSTK